MAYVPNPDDATQPTDAIIAETAQAEFRALKGKVNGIALAGNTKSTFRQGILACAMSGSVAAFLTAGAGLAVTLLASVSPIILTMASGFNNAGAVDFDSVIGADQANYWSALPPSNVSYLTIDNNTTTVNSSGTFVANSPVVTAIPSTAPLTVGMNLTQVGFVQNNSYILSIDSATQLTMSNNALASAVAQPFVASGGLVPHNRLPPPQYGIQYDTGRQSILQFGGAAGSTQFLDDFGNSWAAGGGAKVQTNNFKFGTGGLGGSGAANTLNGTTDLIGSANFQSFGETSWAIRGWFNPSILPTAGNSKVCYQFLNGSNFGIQLAITNVAGVIKFTYWLSSDGASWNIISASPGTTTPVVGTWYFVELTFDALAGAYRLYVNGTQESAAASTAIVCGFTTAIVGSTVSSANGFSGYIDKFELLPYCQHPAGTAYAVPTTAPSVSANGYSSNWFDLINFSMKAVSGPSTTGGLPPTFNILQRIYVGSVATSAAGISSVASYAPRGEYIGPWITPLPAINTIVSATDSIGINQKSITLECKNILSELGFIPNDIIVPLAAQSGPLFFPPTVLARSLVSLFVTSNAVLSAQSFSGGGGMANLAPANWLYRLRVKRNF